MVLAPAPMAGAQPKLTSEPDQTKSDTTLLRDESKAIAELQRRARSYIKFQNGLLVIQDRNSDGISVTPATIFWMVDCGESGLSVTFGTGTGDTDNGIAVQLTAAEISTEICQRIAPAIGETVLAITKGN
jgi:hypothetical protein